MNTTNSIISQGLVWYNQCGMRYEVIDLGKFASTVEFGFNNYTFWQRVIRHEDITRGFDLGTFSLSDKSKQPTPIIEQSAEPFSNPNTPRN